MEIAKVLALYHVSPVLLVVETDDGAVLELTLNALKDGGHRLSEAAWKDILETYQLFTAPATRHATKQAHPQT